MKNINRFIEHTILKADLTQRDIDKIIHEGIENKFAGICVPPFWVKYADNKLGEYDIQLVTIAGFPFGYNKTETKIAEIQQAIGDGADEIDIVWNISAFKSGMEWVKIDIAKCANLIHEHHKILKVIIETAYLSQEEIIKACEICRDAGTDYVKTSTGFAHEGAKVEHVRLIRANLPSHIGVKAAGGIRDLATAVSLIEAGADRLGSSSGVKILDEINNSNQND